jgi:hypothetical protein
MKYYNIEAYITGEDLNPTSFNVIQSHFHKIYVDDLKIIDLLQEQYNQEQLPANQLLNISDENWNQYGYMYNKLNAVDRIKLIDLFKEADVVVKFDLKDINMQLYQEFISKIQYIVDNIEEPGQYVYGPFAITLYNKIDRASEKIAINNPDIKQEHLYKIY